MAESKLTCRTCGHARELHGGTHRTGACRHGGDTNRCACSRFSASLSTPTAELSPPEIEEPCGSCGHARAGHVGTNHRGSCREDGCPCIRWKRTVPQVDTARCVRTITLTARMHDVLMRALACAQARHQPVDDLRIEELRKLTFICRSAKITEVSADKPTSTIWKSPAAQGSRYYRVTVRDAERVYIEPWSVAHDRKRQGESSWNGTRIPPGWIRVDAGTDPGVSTDDVLGEPELPPLKIVRCQRCCFRVWAKPAHSDPNAPYITEIHRHEGFECKGSTQVVTADYEVFDVEDRVYRGADG